MEGITLFSCHNQIFTGAHLLVAAETWGLLAPLRRDAAHRLAALARARADGFEVDDALLQARSEEFRRARGLQSAQATQDWMEAHGVTMSAFGDYLERVALSEQYPPNATTTGDEADGAEGAVEAVLWADVVFTGACDQWCHQLAEQVAVACAHGGVESIHADLATWPEQLQNYARHYEKFSAAHLSAERLNNALRIQWHDFFLIHCEMGLFDSDAAAREASLCVVEDGLSMEAVCKMARGDFARHQLLLRQIPAPLQTPALSAVPGELLPPLKMEGRHMLLAVLNKDEPSVENETTHALLSQSLLRNAIAPLVQEHIQWTGGQHA